MAVDGHDHVDELFEAALNRPPGERIEFLESRCENQAVREEVVSLIRAYEEGGEVFEVLGDVLESVRARVLEREGDARGASAHSDPLDLEGEVVAGYAVEKHLGGGGMGLLYRARDPELRRPVALKFVTPRLAREPEAAERFRREARAATELDHAHVATVYEAGRTDTGRPFLTMAYYKGPALSESLQEGPLSVPEAVSYAKQIASGLEAAHQAGIVHRDVKPANVLITPEDQVKLLDFGLAHLAGRSRITESGQRLGTTAYMSPEQVRGRTIDRRTDLWGLGVLLYEMLTGRRPFGGRSKMATLEAIVHEEPICLWKRRSALPAPLAHIVRRCLAKVPDQRYGSAGALLDDLQAVGSAEGSISMETASWRWPETQASSLSLAVLPFETVGERGTESFARGLHDELITCFSNMSGLRVVARTSVRPYEDTQKTVAEMGRQTGADWILEGHVQIRDGHVRAGARLIDALSSEQAWSGAYRRAFDAERVFRLQAELTNDIAESLKAELIEGGADPVD